MKNKKQRIYGTKTDFFDETPNEKFIWQVIGGVSVFLFVCLIFTGMFFTLIGG